MKVTAQLYGQFLVSSQVNYPGTYLTDHLAGLTHDNVRYFLKTQCFTPRQRWQQVRPQVVFSPRGYVLFDDPVLDKHHRRRIELVRWQYSGNAHGVMAGIRRITCGYVNPETDQFWLIDYRLFAPDADRKTKLDHVADMLAQLAPPGIPYRTVLMDSWYATTKRYHEAVQMVARSRQNVLLPAEKQPPRRRVRRPAALPARGLPVLVGGRSGSR